MNDTNPVKICFRFDDPGIFSDHDLETRVLNLFGQFRFPMTVAVVPFSKLDNHYVALHHGGVPHLSEAHADERIEIAQHGYAHTALSRNKLGAPSEFYGIERTHQKAMMGEGKTVLEEAFGVPIRGFIPPWNTHDDSTLESAADLGFGYLSCGVARGSRVSNPVVIPKTCSLRIDNVRAALANAKRHIRSEPTIVFVFHPDNFVEFRSPPETGEQPPYLSISKLEEILELISQETELITVWTLSKLADHLLKGDSSLWTSIEYDFIQHLSWKLRTRFPTGFFSSRSRFGAILDSIKTRP